LIRTNTQQPAFANPVLIGAVTVLIAVVAVYLSYNATNGLPFVPTRELKLDFTTGAALEAGNDVREGGFRIGVVSDVQPVKLPDGSPGAQATLQLNEANGRLPVDSTAEIRPLSVLGLKYVDLHPGSAHQVFADGATMAVSQTRVPVQQDDVNKLFDAKTRPAVDRDLVGIGDALAGRGSYLNDTIATLPPLLGHLRPVASYLFDPHTELTRFLNALNGFVSTVAPVSQTNAKLFADQATTYEAIARHDLDLENAIKQSPPTLEVGTGSLRVQQPFLVNLRTFADYMDPATAQLYEGLPEIDPALEAGIKVLPRTPSMNVRFQRVLDALRSLALDPGTNVALNGLSSTVGTLNPVIRYLGPNVTVCNYWNYFWAQLADAVSEQTSLGMAERALSMNANRQTNNVAQQGATLPANGYQPGDPPDQTGMADAEYEHGPAYGAAIDSQGNADCETGQRGFELKQNYYDNQNRTLVSDAHTPGDQGTTWTGLSRVPPGETFSREPTTGPQLPNIPGNN
jgi:virulence factor Mce-like protein